MARRLPQYLPLYAATDPWLYVVARLLLAPAARLYGRLEVVGAGRLPRSGPAIVVANHPSSLDPILVALPLARTLHFMADAVQFRRPFVGWCIRRLGAFPMDRDGLARDGLVTALELLRRGEVVALFPEGEVCPEGMHAFEKGAAFLAARSGAPIVPVAIDGAEQVLPGRWWRELPAGWRRRPAVRVTVGPALYLAPSQGGRRAAASHLGELVARLRRA
jgi:1-acyl-sn-glycerol-3-phosphate acyltransferase